MMMMVNSWIFIASSYVKKKVRDARGEVVCVGEWVSERLKMNACDTCLCKRNRMFWTASLGLRLWLLSPVAATVTGAPLLCSSALLSGLPAAQIQEEAPRRWVSLWVSPAVIWTLCGCVKSGRSIKRQCHFRVSILAALCCCLSSQKL